MNSIPLVSIRHGRHCRRSAVASLLLAVVLLMAMAMTMTAQQPLPSDDIGLEPPPGADDDGRIDQPIDETVEPLNLRTATADQIASLPGITIQDAIAIVELVRYNRRARLQSLEAIDGLTAEKLSTLATYCTLVPMHEPAARRATVSQRTRIRHELQQRQGYRTELRRGVRRAGAIDTIVVGRQYSGSPLGVLGSLDYDDGSVTGHLLIAKDPGEPFLIADTSTFAYTRFELDTARIDHRVEQRAPFFAGGGLLWRFAGMTIALGDFSAGAGNGLALAGSQSIRASTVPRSERMLALHHSASETSYLRGIAVSGELHRIATLLFYSNRYRDASIDSVVIDREQQAVARSLHDGMPLRTHSDIRRSGNLAEQIIGARILWNARDLSFGATAYDVRYGIPILSRRAQLWSGREGTIFSVDGAVRAGRVDLRAEIARSPGDAIALSIGASARFDRVLLEAGLTSTPERFSVPHGSEMNPFSSGDGLVAGCSIRASAGRSLEVEMSTSAASRERSGAGLPGRSTAVSSAVAARYTFPNGELLRGSIRRRASMETGSTTRNGLERDLTVEHGELAAGIDMTLTPSGSRSTLRAGLLFSAGEGSGEESGRLVFLEMAHEPMKGIRISGRYTLFQSEVPLYQFEQPLPGWPRSVRMDGRGSRYWLKVATGIGPARLAAFVARSTYADRKVIGEGSPEQINGDSAAMAGLQLDLRFDL